jgi:hypothetical protein
MLTMIRQKSTYIIITCIPLENRHNDKHDYNELNDVDIVYMLDLYRYRSPELKNNSDVIIVIPIINDIVYCIP